MSETPDETRKTAIAALIILLVVGAALYFMPPIVLAIAQYSPVLGFAFGAVVIFGFFAIFWLRSRYRK
jgi:hypothetical protein